MYIYITTIKSIKNHYKLFCQKARQMEPIQIELITVTVLQLVFQKLRFSAVNKTYKFFS